MGGLVHNSHAYQAGQLDLNAAGRFGQERIIRLFQRQIQGFVHLLQLLTPLDIATPGEHAALGLTEIPPDLSKVQQRECLIGKALGLGDKAIFRTEPAQLGIGDHALHKVAAVRAVHQVDQPGQGDGLAHRDPLHRRQPLKDRYLGFAQPCELSGQGIQLRQGTIVLIHVLENVSGVKRAKKLPLGRLTVCQLQFLHCVQQGVAGGGQGQFRAQPVL